ncbi:three component ABC system middle component [Fodinibius halophilus]|uniref:Uncharacterized protein n=1 Tax=Fodinibius halophilus TaxID=1736908 RepID=A0A6M1T1Z9_9BACT|nr:three component ABC system middle component [Fodinibius halophilus]NGP88019.1 hypothetical protein [Fodinibius halophilus]
MSNIVDALYQTKYNPFKYGNFLASFYLELANVKNNILLSQLVIPLCSHHLFKPKIENAVFGEKRRSTIWTIFKDRVQLYDLQERLVKFETLTEQSFQYCLINDWLEIEPKKLEVVVRNDCEINFKTERSAANLGKLFSNLSVIEIYSFLGVKPQ